jgi:hypothetical protein
LCYCVHYFLFDDELDLDELDLDDERDEEPKLDLEELDDLADEPELLDLDEPYDELGLGLVLDDEPKELDPDLGFVTVLGFFIVLDFVVLDTGLDELVLLNPDVTGLEFVVVLNDLCDAVGAAIDFTLADTTGEDLEAFGDTILLVVLVVVLVIVVFVLYGVTLELYDLTGTLR